MSLPNPSLHGLGIQPWLSTPPPGRSSPSPRRWSPSPRRSSPSPRRWSPSPRRLTPIVVRGRTPFSGTLGFQPWQSAVVRRVFKETRLRSMTPGKEVGGLRFRSTAETTTIWTFQVMDKYCVPPRVAAANSLLTAMCSQNGGVLKSLEFLETMKRSKEVGPDGDSFEILLEALEKEGNSARAKTVFGEIVVGVGWIPANVSAYDAFLKTLVRGEEIEEAVKFLGVMKKNGCLPGLSFLSTALDILLEKKSGRYALLIWDVLVGNGVMPDLAMYNAMSGLLCDCNEVDHGIQIQEAEGSLEKLKPCREIAVPLGLVVRIPINLVIGARKLRLNLAVRIPISLVIGAKKLFDGPESNSCKMETIRLCLGPMEFIKLVDDWKSWPPEIRGCWPESIARTAAVLGTRPDKRGSKSARVWEWAWVLGPELSLMPPCVTV